MAVGVHGQFGLTVTKEQNFRHDIVAVIILYQNVEERHAQEMTKKSKNVSQDQRMLLSQIHLHVSQISISKVSDIMKWMFFFKIFIIR